MSEWMNALKLFWRLVFMGSVAVFIGCSATEKKTVDIGDSFSLNQVSLTLVQTAPLKTPYYSESALEALLNKHIRKHLNLQGRSSQHPGVNKLNIHVVYKRHFLDEQASLSLAYPYYDFEINILNGQNIRQVLATVEQKDKVFKGRFIMDIDMQAGRLKHPSDEVVFIDGIAKSIVRALHTFK